MDGFSPEYRLALAQNVATNGRWFCALLVLICICAFSNGQGNAFAAYAVFASSGIGLASVADMIPHGVIQRVVSATAILMPAGTAIAILFSIG